MEAIYCVCGRQMQILMNTPVCIECDKDTIYELGFIRTDLEDTRLIEGR